MYTISGKYRDIYTIYDIFKEPGMKRASGTGGRRRRRSGLKPNGGDLSAQMSR